jgi:hypothetical protein
MSKMIEINLKPDVRTLRQFGFIALVGFALLATIAWFELLVFSFGLGAARPYVAGGFAAVAGLSLLFSLIYPRANLGLYLGLTIIAYPIGFVLSYLIMGTLFFLLITPVVLLLRLLVRDPMERRMLPEAESYWVNARGERPSESYFKQF